MFLGLKLEAWYYLSQIALTGIVAVSAAFALIQLRLLKRQSQATFLMELDHRWEGSDMADARVTVLDFKKDVERAIEADWKHLTQEEKRRKYEDLFEELLKKLHKEDTKHYLEFARAWGFFETLGYLTKKRYFKAEAVATLFGFSIQQFEDMSKRHILWRDADECRKTGKAPHLYENFLEMAREVDGHINRLAVPSSYLRRLWLHLRNSPLPRLS